ncbi:hypothetical protein ACVL92_009209 [Bradyrhizobium liaoningense]
MGKRLCAPSPRLGLTRRGLSLRLRSNGALAAASSPHQAPGRRLAPPRSSVRRLRTPGSCVGGGVGSRSCFTEHAALPTDRDPRGWLWRLKKRQADAANDLPPSRMQSVGGEVASGPTKTVSEPSPRSMEDTEDRRSGRDRTKLPGWDWSSFAGAGKQEGRRRRTRRRDGPTAPDPGLLFRSYRWARSSSRRLVNGSAFSAKSLARCAKPL